MSARLVSTVQSSTTAAISKAEFANALFSTWRNYGPNARRRPNVFGLAISGGVDSMALAALCSEIQQTPVEEIVSGLHPTLAKFTAAVVRDLEFQAFVVDHGVREGSDVEAKAVSNVLEQRGIQTRVLKIDWGTHERLAELPNFESLARRYRFRALGKACRDAGINSLFLAHHQDDQVETVMMRMINGHRIFGLRGMKRDCEIPECHGIHGVHESGALDTTKDHAVSAPPQVLQRKQDTRRKRFQPKINLATEMGGVRVYRPLLGFTKSRLIDTCTAAKMEWFEDHTNKDPTITTRNAIRHMYSTYAMPTALAPLSILSLSEKFEKKHDHLQKVADSLFEAANKLFMTRSGTMIIKFPDLRFLESSLSPDDLKLVASLLLRQAISFVTPQEHARLHSLHGSVCRVFPEILKDVEPSEPVIFTVSGVQFKPMPPSISHQESEARPEWYLSRQLYSSAGSDRPDIDLSTCDLSHRDGSWTPWMLYDGRFWFRIQKKPRTPLTLRPLQKGDMVDFKKGLGRFDQLRFKDILRQVAPADVRWTLPAIAHKEWNGKEIVVALPTVDLAIVDSQRLVEWEVRYKKVDVEILKGGGTEII